MKKQEVSKQELSFFWSLRDQYPLLLIKLVDRVVHVPHEDAFYPVGGGPRPTPIEGGYVSIENPMGGRDVVSIKNITRLNELCKWHNKRTTENLKKEAVDLLGHSECSNFEGKCWVRLQQGGEVLTRFVRAGLAYEEPSQVGYAQIGHKILPVIKYW